jgi:integrase
MLNTGLRMSEAAALKWSDYDKDGQTIRVYTTLIQNKDENGKSVIEEQDSVKTKNSERVLKLNARAIEAIEAIAKKPNSDYIFCAKNGKPLRPRNIQNKLDSILNRAEIEHKGTHVFRHTYASKLFAKGIDVKIVSDLLGHADVRTTYNTYIKLIKQQKAQAMDSIELY